MKAWKKIALWKKILIGVVIGLIVGFVSPEAADFISPLGDIFMRMLKMLIVPLVFFSITSGVCKMGDVKQLRTVGMRYMLWIVVSAVIAAIFGMVGGLIVQPGKGVTDLLTGVEATEAQEYSFIDNVIEWFPTNIVESMVNANMLQIIVFCLFLGVALLALGEKAKTIIKFIDEGSETMLKITEYVIDFSPFGILSLIATMVSTISSDMMKSVIGFMGKLIPVSRVLLGAEKGGLMNYLNRWFVKNAVISENSKIFSALKAGYNNGTVKAVAGWKALKKSITVDLDPSCLIDGVIITNQSGFAALDAEEDSDGRPVLQPNPANPTEKLFQGLPIHVFSDAQLANIDATHFPVIYGSVKAGCTFVEHQSLQFDVSEQFLFNKNQNCLRVIEGFDVLSTDTSAYVYGSFSATV